MLWEETKLESVIHIRNKYQVKYEKHDFCWPVVAAVAAEANSKCSMEGQWCQNSNNQLSLGLRPEDIAGVHCITTTRH